MSQESQLYSNQNNESSLALLSKGSNQHNQFHE